MRSVGNGFGARDVVGVGWDRDKEGSIFLTVNGKLIGNVFGRIPRFGNLYPILVVNPQITCSGFANFGQSEFLYDVSALRHASILEDVMAEKRTRESLVRERSGKRPIIGKVGNVASTHSQPSPECWGTRQKRHGFDRPGSGQVRAAQKSSEVLNLI